MRIMLHKLTDRCKKDTCEWKKNYVTVTEFKTGFRV